MAYKLKITIDNRVIEKVLLNARKTIDGSIIVRDHPEIDIFINPNTSKVVAFPKEQMDDEVYDSQDRLFKDLVLKGVVDYNSVQSGNLFMSMEAKILEADSGDKIQFVLYAISTFIDKDKPFYDDLKDFEKEMENQLLEPEPDEYTEFDPDVHHDETKGSLPPRFVRWGISNIYRL
jgi:hypothetical protein